MGKRRGCSGIHVGLQATTTHVVKQLQRDLRTITLRRVSPVVLLSFLQVSAYA